MGRRLSEASFAEPPPPHVRWLHESLLARSRARLALCEQPAPAAEAEAEASLALEDAVHATVLCCRAREGWQALVAAAEACGNEDQAALARRQLALL